MACALSTTALAQDADDNGRPVADDKIMHFSVSAVGTSSSIKLLQAFNPYHEITLTNRILSSLMIAAIGVAKEMHDSTQPNNSYDNQDNEANFYGILTGNILQWEF